MNKLNIIGKVVLLQEGNLLKYGIYRGFDMFDLDNLLWNNTKSLIHIKIKNINTNKIFKAIGKLFVSYKDGYEKYVIKNNKELIDLDEVLWNSVDNTVEIKIKNVKIEGK